MSDIEDVGASAGETIRPLSVRMLDSHRAQLEIIAKLNERSVTEEVRLAIEAWLDSSKKDPVIQQRAAAVRSEIEQEAAMRRQAIESIFDSKPTPAKRGTAGKGDQRQ